MWELDCEEGWVPKNWCFWTVVLEKILESPLDCKEIQPVHPKDQSWIFIERTDAEGETLILWTADVKNWFIGRTDAEAPILWPPDEESQLPGKDPDAGKDWGWEEKEVTEDETVR